MPVWAGRIRGQLGQRLAYPGNISQQVVVANDRAERPSIDLVGQLDQTGHRIVEFPELERRFETIVIAGESGIPPKPDPLPFYVCLEKLQLGTDEVVFVGDDWSIDIEGAMNIGIQAVWLKHRSVRRNWPEVEGW